MSGGKRQGAGRKPGPHGVKVTLATRVSAAVKAFLESTGNASETIEQQTRRSRAFRDWHSKRDNE